LATGAVTTTNILDGTIVAADLAQGSVTTTNILNGTIAAADLATGAVTSTNILDGTIVAADMAQRLSHDDQHSGRSRLSRPIWRPAPSRAPRS
jgi:hypothetical protein